MRFGRCSVPTNLRYRSGAGTSATTARRARTSSPPAVRTPTAVPRPTSTRSTGWSQRTRPPRSARRRTNASVNDPAPPSGTGNPMSCASMVRSQPNSPLPASLGTRSVCMAQPVNSSWAPAPANRSSASRRTGDRRRRANRSASAAPSSRSSRAEGRTGGNGRSKARSRSSRTRSHCSYSALHASPSALANAATDSAVRSRSVDRTTLRSSGRTCASGSGARRHRKPYRSSSSSRRTGDATPSGKNALHWSLRKPGWVDSRVWTPPPGTSVASRTTTSQPASASTLAATSPLGPAPMTTASTTSMIPYTSSGRSWRPDAPAPPGETMPARHLASAYSARRRVLARHDAFEHVAAAGSHHVPRPHD